MTIRKSDPFHSLGALQSYAIDAFSPNTVDAKPNGEIVMRDTALGAMPTRDKATPKPKSTPGAFGRERADKLRADANRLGMSDDELAHALADLGITPNENWEAPDERR